jgi:hypothetical protein
MSQEKATLPEWANQSTQTTMDVPPMAVYKFLKPSPATTEEPAGNRPSPHLDGAATERFKGRK